MGITNVRTTNRIHGRKPLPIYKNGFTTNTVFSGNSTTLSTMYLTKPERHGIPLSRRYWVHKAIRTPFSQLVWNSSTAISNPSMCTIWQRLIFLLVSPFRRTNRARTQAWLPIQPILWAVSVALVDEVQDLPVAACVLPAWLWPAKKTSLLITSCLQVTRTSYQPVRLQMEVLLHRP